MPRRPLEGLRVIDMTVVWAGPFGSALLGDMGAEVIRVESLQHWDLNTRGQFFPLETMQKTTGDVDPDAKPWDLSANHNSVGRNKRSVTIDLTRPEGREVFYRLAEKSDIFIENNPTDVIRKLCVGYEILSQRNPRLIMLSMPAFGTTGPYESFRAFGANMEAVVGHTLLRGYPDSDATNNTGVFLADAAGGATGAFALLAALHYRNRTGKGQFIDMSQAENVTHTLSQAFMDYSMNRRVQTTLGNRDPARAPQGVYRCTGEDNWIALSCGSDAEFRGLCNVMGRPELATDERFADGLSRHDNQDALDPEISAWSVGQDYYEAFHALQAVGVACSPVLNSAAVFADAQLQERGVWQRLKHPKAGTHWYLGPIIGHMSKTPLKIWKYASTLGEDNEYVYKEVCGYTDEEYQRFVETQHAGTEIIAKAKAPAAPR
ncbi:MAG TPA: CoA transferase [Dehalococcoidia bacterium]|nr:CoA transferase [Dehalococcoidia bacterium]